MNKKKIITLCLVVCLIVTAVAGVSLAYFTDTDSAENTFTVGKIKLIESSLHRENAGINNGYTADTLPANANKALWSADAKEGNGKDITARPYQSAETYYTDEQIIQNAEEYAHEDIALVPGQTYHKMPYVLNTGKNNAYIRIRVMIPSAANNDFDENVENGGVITNQWTSTAFDKGEYVHGDGGPKWPIVDREGHTDADGVKYDVYTFIHVKPLAPNEMTYWNVWGYIGLADKADNDDIQKAINAGALDKDGNFKILVEADAIQADGFDGYEAAWTAFDAQKAANP